MEAVMGGWRFHSDGNVEFDFHDFAHYEAEELAPQVARAAWQRGCSYVTLSHGAGDVPSSGWWPHTRGSIKRALYSLWNQGAFNEWAWYRRSVKHSTTPTRIRLALRPNTKPTRGELPDCGAGLYS
jgi:hypothetical protein